jgi:transmembrane sensor
MGAGVTLAVLAGVILIGERGDVHTTAVGQQLAVRLDDGSLVRLNTESEVRVLYTAGRRLVDLVRGQAFFEVRPDADRTFRVTADGLEVVALGTRFDVMNLSGQPARVVLAEGAVRVAGAEGGWDRELSRAGQAVLAGPGAAPEVGTLDLEAVTSWTAGLLTFRGTPLGQAVDEVNRYSRVKIDMQATGLSELQVDGVFEAGDFQAFLSAVTALFPLEAHRSGDRIVLRSR